MSSTQVALGSPDPLIAGDGEPLCGDHSDVVVGMPGPLLCTRAAGHTDRRIREHVASGPYESRLPIALAVWTDGSAPQLMDLPR